jgi:hypothetical protein
LNGERFWMTKVVKSEKMTYDFLYWLLYSTDYIIAEQDKDGKLIPMEITITELLEKYMGSD